MSLLYLYRFKFAVKLQIILFENAIIGHFAIRAVSGQFWPCCCRLVPSRYLNFNFIGTNRYISISIYIDQYQRWTRARGKGKAREKITTGRLQRQNGGQFYNKT